ncbi:MAG: AAA family ATPase [Chitinophagales bacterium]|nr:AAA family ATPase [Chitinophagales bacterium]
MIHQIVIQNYKSITHLELELGRLNVFIGENGCGKTNVLEAITCSSVGVVSYKSLPETLLSLKGVRITDPLLMQPVFEQKNATTEIIITDHLKNKFTLELKDFQENTTIKHHIDLTPESKEGKDYLDLSDTDYFLVQTHLSQFLNYAPENYFLRRFEEEGQIRPIGIRGEGLFKHLVQLYKNQPDLLSKIRDKLRLIGWFEGFEIPSDLMFTERRINIKDKYLQEIDFFDQRSANEGFLYLLFYFTLFISPYTPAFFAIDNIDNALNPKLCSELIRQLASLCTEHNKQVILTTHNPAILDGLDLHDDNQRLFTIYRNADGHTIARRIKPLKEVKGVEKVRLSEAFIRGYLGGLPKNF